MKEIQKTLALEGGYVFDTDDPGGETKYGISKKYHPEVDIQKLTIEQAEAIYKAEYWDKLHCDGYKYSRFAWKIFDIAVNQGTGTAMAFIQKVKKPDTLEGIWELIEMQMKRYVQKTVESPVKLKYLKGWTNRAFDTAEEFT
jgi:lysozyme family protein